MKINSIPTNTYFKQIDILRNDDNIIQIRQEGEQKLTIEQALAQLTPIPDKIHFTHQFKFIDECYEVQEESIFEIESIGKLRLGGHYKASCCGGENPKVICVCGCCKCKYKCFDCDWNCDLKNCICNTCQDKIKCDLQNFECNVLSCQCKCAICCILCCVICCCSKCCKDCCECCKSESLHMYTGPLYVLENENIRYEHYTNSSKLYVKNTLVLYFNHSSPNYADIYYGSCKSNNPHIYFTNPSHDENYKVLFEPQGNKCPEHLCTCFPCCIICSLCGIQQKERKFFAQVENSGIANITATRTSKQACYSQLGCRDRRYHFVDYPNFQIEFNNISMLDKLGIIMSAINYSIYQRWQKFNWNGLFYFNLPEYYYQSCDL